MAEKFISAQDAITAVQFTMNPAGFLIGKIAEYAMGSVDSAEEEDSDLEKLKVAARKQELQMHMAEAQAKVAQELAIAKKIEMAEEVEIEEFYDLTGDARVGLSQAAESITLGASASGSRVSKRIYKFRGGAQASVRPDGIEPNSDTAK